MPHEPLAGQVCVVTGSARGLGRAIAEALARAGATLVLTDVDAAVLEETAGALAADGHAVHHRPADISVEREVSELAGWVRDTTGGAHVLVNNAGLAHIGPSMTFPLELWQQSIDVMATGTFLCCREFGPQLREHGTSSIVNISSINARVAFPMRLAYDAAKAAVEAMTEVLAIEWAGYGIRVNAIAPGVMDTRMLRDAAAAGKLDIDAYVDRVPMRRLGDPDEIGNVAVFLASAQSSFITGQVITPDGGWSAFGFVPWSGDPEHP